MNGYFLFWIKVFLKQLNLKTNPRGNSMISCLDKY